MGSLQRKGALAALALGVVFAGCGNDPRPEQPGADAGDGDGDGDGDEDVPSGVFLEATVISLETGAPAEGVVAHFEDSELESDPSGADGVVRIPIPEKYCGDGAYPVFGGAGYLDTLVAPELDLECDADQEMAEAGWVIDAEGGMRDTIATELAAAGAISAEEGASGEAFAEAYNWVYVLVADAGVDGTLSEAYEDGTVMLRTHLPGLCDVYYTNDYAEFKAGTVDTFVDTELENAANHTLLLVCESRSDEDVAMSGTGFVDEAGDVVTLPASGSAMMPGGAAVLEWHP